MAHKGGMCKGLEWSACPPSVSVETKSLNKFIYCIAGFHATSSPSHLPTTVDKTTGNESKSKEKCCRRNSGELGGNSNAFSVCRSCTRLLCDHENCGGHRNLTCYKFYRCGANVGLFTSVSSVVLLLYTILHAFASPSVVSASEQTAEVLTPLVPGVNIPWSHTLYIFIGYGTSTFIHEMGHALALATVGKHIDCVGWFIMCGLPGAYVKCSTSAIQSLSPHKQLHVFFAGVWHNVLLTVGVCLLINAWQYFPYLPGLIFRSGDGVTVLSVVGAEKVMEQDLSEIQTGDLIVSLSDRQIHSVNDYKNALGSIYTEMGSNMSDPILIQYYHSSMQGFGQTASPLTAKWSNGPEAMFRTFDVVDSRPGSMLQPVCSAWVLYCLYIPHITQLTMYYIASISGGLALVNSLPVYGLDGEDAFKAWLKQAFPDLSSSARSRIISSTLRCGSALLVAALLMSFASLIR